MPWTCVGCGQEQSPDTPAEDGFCPDCTADDEVFEGDFAKWDKEA